MHWFYNMKTMKKLVLGFAVVCAIMAVVGWIGVSKVGSVNVMLNTLYERELIGLSEIKEANTNLINIGRATRMVVLEKDEAEMRRYAQNIEKYETALNTSLEAAEATFISNEAKNSLGKIKETLPLYMEKVDQVVNLSLQDKIEEAQQVLTTTRADADLLDDLMTKLAQTKEQMAADAYEESDVLYGNSVRILMVIIVGGVILGLAIGVFIARIIANPLTQAVRVLESVADGDFTVNMEATTTDEVGQMANSLNKAIDSIQEALSGVRTVADDVAAASTQLSSASEQLASGAQESASSLEETASSLEEITATVKQNADNADQANQLSNGSRETAEKGGAVVGDAVNAMSEINHASKKISDIIITIDEIAFQTNLLALNAAVEAARAGEQGRGFAVVAGEVRNLAQRSASAAKEIKALIQDSVQKVENGSELVNRSGQTLEEIVNSVKRVTDIVAEIAAASREQAAGIDQVNKAMAQLDQVTQANASQTEEMSGTAVSLSGQGDQLQTLIRRFKLSEEPTRQRSLPRPPTSKPVSPPAARHPEPQKSKAMATNGKSNGHHRNGKNGHELDLIPAGAGAGADSNLNGFEEF